MRDPTGHLITVSAGPEGHLQQCLTQSLVPTSHRLLLHSPGCVQTGAGPWLSVPNPELNAGAGSPPFSTSKPPTIVCRARNEPTQRSIKPGRSQPAVPLTPNCPLSLVCVRVCVCHMT